MENKVGSVLPLDKEVAALLEEIATIDEKVARFVNVRLSPEERRQALKFRPGEKKVVALVGRLANERGVQIPGFSVEDMDADLTLADRLRPLLSAAESLRQRLDDGLLQAESECWSAATAFYSVLQSVAARDPQLATALRPAIDFFALGRRRPQPAPAK